MAGDYEIEEKKEHAQVQVKEATEGGIQCASELSPTLSRSILLTSTIFFKYRRVPCRVRRWPSSSPARSVASDRIAHRRPCSLNHSGAAALISGFTGQITPEESARVLRKIEFVRPSVSLRPARAADDLLLDTAGIFSP